MRRTAGFWYISLPFAAWITLYFYLDRNGGAVYSLSAAALHECGHLLMLLWFGEQPRRLLVSFFGMRLEHGLTTRLSYTRESAVYAAGPAANLLCALVLRLLAFRVPGLLYGARTQALLGAFNLLPFRPMDGGQILYTLLCRRTVPEQAAKISKITAACGAIPLAAWSLFACIRHGWDQSLVVSSLYVLCVVVLP